MKNMHDIAQVSSKTIAVVLSLLSYGCGSGLSSGTPNSSNPDPSPTGSNSPSSFVLGQPDFVSNRGLQTGFNNPYTVSSDGTRFLVSDYSNNRILIWNSLPTSTQSPPSLVLGQIDLSTNSSNYGGSVSASSLFSPYRSYISGGKLFAVDVSNHRVLIWNTIPTSNYTAADVVLGQPDMTSGSVNAGGTTAATTLSNPQELLVVGTKLIVADMDNNRVLIWNTIPTSNQTAADVVIGQAGMTTSASGVTSQTLNHPVAVASNGTKLIISDTNNKRVLIYNTIPTSNSAAADVVIGQPNMTSNLINNNGSGSSINAAGLSSPRGVFVSGLKLYVADTGNHRVLVWNTVPTTNFASADLVLGQSIMTAGTVNAGGGASAPTSQSLSSPRGIYSDGTRLYVADAGNARVLGWNTIPTTNQAAADFVLGQSSMSNYRAIEAGVSAQTLRAPDSAFTDGTHLVVADRSNNRVLIWNTIPTSNQTAADVVLGQGSMTSFTANNPSAGASTLGGPNHAIICGTKLLVSDSGNYRVLIWNTIPTSDGAAASVVLGQPNMTTTGANTGGISAQTFSTLGGIACVGDKLVVGDYGNHRILIWNTFPTSNGAAASVVLGQPDFVSSASGTNAQALSNPWHIASDGTRLIASDFANNRVLIWNSVPTSNQTAADVVLGQPDMVSNTANNGGIGAGTLRGPVGLFTRGTKLYIADSGNHRVLVWNSIPTANFAAADSVYGQSGFTTRLANAGGISSSGLNLPYGVFSYGDYLYITESGNSRVLGITPSP